MKKLVIAIAFTVTVLLLATVIMPLFVVNTQAKGVLSIDFDFKRPATESYEIGELLEKRTEHTKTYYLGDNKYSQDSHIIPIHYKDPFGELQDIDTTYTEPDIGEFSTMFIRIPYIVRMKDDSGRRIYPDRDDLTYWIQLEAPFDNMGQPDKQGDWWYWNFNNAVIAIKIDNSKVKFGFRLKNPSASSSITIPFTSQGITRNGNLLYHDGEVVAVLEPPYAIDANGVERDCQVTFNPGSVTVSLDTTGLKYPIEIDPTLDVDIVTDADDGQDDGANWATTVTDMVIRPASGYTCAYRFTSINVTAGATFTGSYIDLYSSATRTADGNDVHIYCDDQNDPGQIADHADFAGRTRTTAFAQWTIGNTVAGTRYTSVGATNMDAPIQEIYDSHGPFSNEAILLFVGEDGNTNTQYKFKDSRNGASTVPKLHLEWTEGAAAASIANTPATYDFGVLALGANATTGLDHFTVTNDGSDPVNVSFNGTNATGNGYTHTLSSTATAGTDTFGLKMGFDGGSYNCTVNTTAQTFIYALAASSNTSYGFQLFAPTEVNDGQEKDTTITLTASLS